MSIRDIIMVVCKKDAHTAANTWLNIDEDKKEEVAQYLCNFRMCTWQSFVKKCEIDRNRTQAGAWAWSCLGSWGLFSEHLSRKF